MLCYESRELREVIREAASKVNTFDVPLSRNLASNKIGNVKYACWYVKCSSNNLVNALSCSNLPCT